MKTKRIATFMLCLALLFVMGGECLLSPFLVKAVANAVQSYDDTAIEQDMADMEEAKYPANPFGEPSVVGFMEYCYSENSHYSSVYNLYIYVYNPSEKPLIMRNGANTIQMSVAFGSDGKMSNEGNLQLDYLDHTDNFRFYKFKLSDASSQYKLAKEYANLWNGRRRYEVTAINLKYEGEAQNKTSGVSKIYEFSGYSAWCGEPSIALSSLECKFYGKDDILLEIYDTNYRFASKGDYLYDDLQSVYFSIPNEHFEKWGELHEITAEWYQYKTAPIFVTSDASAYSSLWNMINYRINEKGQLIDEQGNVTNEAVKTYWRVLWEEYNDVIGNGSGALSPTTINTFMKAYNAKCREDFGWDGSLGDMFNDSKSYALDSNYEWLSKFDWMFYVNDPEKLEDCYISSDSVKEYMQTYTNKFSNQQKLHDRYAEDLFVRTEGDGYKVKTFVFGSTSDENGNPYEYIDNNKNQSAWSKFWFGAETISYSYTPIVKISEGDLHLSAADFSAKYLVNKYDAETIKKFAEESYKNNETPVVLRFALTDYYASKARYDYAEEKFAMSDIDGYVAQETVFLDFDILTMSFMRNGSEKTVLGVVADSIDIITGLTPPDDVPIEEEEWWQKIMAILLLIFFLIVLTNIFFPVFIPIFKGFVRGLGLLIRAGFRIITFPFRLLFQRKRK